MTHPDDVREFLMAYVDEAVRQGVTLISEQYVEMKDGKPCYCLFASLVSLNRPSGSRPGFPSGASIKQPASKLLGVNLYSVEAMIEGWDNDWGFNLDPNEYWYEYTTWWELGRGLRHRYESQVRERSLSSQM